MRVIFGRNEGEARSRLQSEQSAKEVTNVMRLVNEKYVTVILLELAREDLGFNELQRRLRINANTLRARLGELEHQGIVTRSLTKKPSSSKARLTELGRELVAIAGRIQECEREWDRVLTSGRTVNRD